jgi:ATP-binding cassette subfamily G (WHITE) protein 2 (PDR)
MQIRLCVRRAYQRLINDKSALSRLWYVFEKISPLEHVRHPADSELIGKIVMALVVGSVFYGTPNTTGSFFSKGETSDERRLLENLLR